MPAPQPRTFEDVPAEREKTPILVGLFAPSGGGKTYSALRLATGIVSVTGGEIFVIDTDNRRALQYADLFKFRHVNFSPPHSSLAYVDALRFAVARGAGCIVVDGMSHEHEGTGGMLDFHESELDRLAGDDFAKRERMKMIAWAAPKAARRKLILEIQRLGVPTIFCFRAKEGVKPVKGANGRSEVVQQGFTPIAGDEFVFEMTVCGLLLPGSRGVPTWNPEQPGEKKMVKLPAQFERLAAIEAPLDEKLGKAFADWSLGGKPAPKREETPQEGDPGPGPETRTEPSTPSGGPDSPPADDFPGDRPSPPPADEPEGDPRDDDDVSDSAEDGFDPGAGAGDPRSDEEKAVGLTDKAIDSSRGQGSAGAFATFADLLSGAEDWPSIADALRTLTTSPAWKAADRDRQHRARVLAYRRLRELNESGYGFDFLKDAHAFRCYIEAEENDDELALNFLAFKTMPAWGALPEAARKTFVDAVDSRCALLRAGSTPSESFA